MIQSSAVGRARGGEYWRITGDYPQQIATIGRLELVADIRAEIECSLAASARGEVKGDTD